MFLLKIDGDGEIPGCPGDSVDIVTGYPTTLVASGAQIGNPPMNTTSTMLNVSSYTTIDTVLCFTVGLPKETTLQDNDLFKIFPNPYKGETKISFKLIREAHVTVGVYNVLGEKIVKLVEGMQLAGEHNYSFSAEALGQPAGLYIVLIKVGSEQYSKKIVEIR